LVTVQFEPPSDFPRPSWQAVLDNVSAHTGEAAFGNFAGGWNAVAYRFRACCDCGEAFASSVRQHGDAPPFPHRYFQERDLFAFFVTGFSALESFCFAMFFVGSFIQPNKFRTGTVDDLRKINATATAGRLISVFPDVGLGQALRDVHDCDESKEWRNLRNLLVHRTAPGRHIFASLKEPAGVPQQSSTWGGIPIDENLTTSRRTWLANSLQTICEEAEVFTTRVL
jgi:hypothetical protein